MRIVQGVNSLLQLSALLSKLYEQSVQANDRSTT